jgi:ABC-type thiamin/hydroxymethylpyrimidine transport system permease subunit
MGAFQGEWHHNLHILPTTCSVCSVVFAAIFIYYKDFKTRNTTGFGALAGQIQHIAAQKK